MKAYKGGRRQDAVELEGNSSAKRETRCRLSFTWFGTRKSLTPEQKAVAAESFGAAGDYLSAGKKLINMQHPKFKAVSSVKSRAVSYFKGMSLPYPEPGLRLIKQTDLSALTAQLTTFKQALDETVDELDDHYGELKSAARQRLGDLYCESDYPASLDGLFDMTWDFPSVEPPDYLRRLSPELYEQECRRVEAAARDATREDLQGLEAPPFASRRAGPAGIGVLPWVDYLSRPKLN